MPYRKARLRRDIVLVFAETALFALASLSLISPADLRAGPYAARTAPGRVEFFERERRLVLLPLANMTGEAKLEYLREGVMKILADRFKNAGFLWIERPETLLAVAPLPGGESVPRRPTRLALAVDAPRLDRRVYEIQKQGDVRRRARSIEADYLLEGAVLSPAEYARQRERAGSQATGPADAADGATEALPDAKEISSGASDLLLEMNFFETRTGRRARRVFRLDRRRIYDGLDQVAEDLFGLFLGRPLVKFRVETPRPGAMVFVGDLYLGRTPLEYRLIPGDYRLTVRQKGFLTTAREIALSPDGPKIFRVDVEPEPRAAALRVESTPPGAAVFLDQEYLGTTPLQRADLPAGAHRIRLSLEGHVDRFAGVELAPGAPRAVSISMEKGDTVAEYTDPHRVVLDWDNHDISFYSLLNSLGFYLGYIHFNVRADRTDDSVVALVPTLSILELDELGLYHYQIIRRKADEAALQRRYANVSAGGGVFSVLAAAFFLWRGIAFDEREIGEIGLHFSERYEPGPSAPVAVVPAGEARAGTRSGEIVYRVGVEWYY